MQICQRTGFGYQKTETIALKVNGKNDLWEFDIVGPLPISKKGYRYLLTMIDHATKRVEVRPLKTKEASEVIERIEEIVNLLGTPKIILTDNGKEFTNSLAKELSIRKGILWRYGAPYSPTTTGLIERFSRTLLEKLRKLTVYGIKDWADELEATLKSYMNSYHRATGSTPKEAWYGEKNLKERHKEKYRKSYTTKCRRSKGEWEILVGDKVLYHNPLGRKNKLAADYDIEGQLLKNSIDQFLLDLMTEGL